jgi:hypothetical protein
MVPSGRSPLAAFGPIIDHPIFKAARDRGAIVVRMPKLGCMQEIDRRRLSFEDAENGNVKPGQEKFPPTMQQMVALWRRALPETFAPILPWLD